MGLFIIHFQIANKMISKINVAHMNMHGVKARPEAVVPAQLENA
jgi:hypothetical protein